MKGAIFDMDGTLLDSMQVWVHVGEQYLWNRGIEPEEGLGDVLFPMSMRDGAVYVKEKYSLPDPPDTIVTDMDAIVFAAYRDEVLPKPGVAAYLESLKKQGIPMAVATATNRRWWRRRSRGQDLPAILNRFLPARRSAREKKGRTSIWQRQRHLVRTRRTPGCSRMRSMRLRRQRQPGFIRWGFTMRRAEMIRRRLPAWRTAMCGRFNLFPHKTVLENVMLAPVHVKKMEKGRAEALAKERIGKAGLADKVVFMADGRILEEGKPEEIFSNPKTPEARQFLRSVL